MGAEAADQEDSDIDDVELMDGAGRKHEIGPRDDISKTLNTLRKNCGGPWTQHQECSHQRDGGSTCPMKACVKFIQSHCWSKIVQLEACLLSSTPMLCNNHWS